MSFLLCVCANPQLWNPKIVRIEYLINLLFTYLLNIYFSTLLEFPGRGIPLFIRCLLSASSNFQR